MLILTEWIFFLPMVLPHTSHTVTFYFDLSITLPLGELPPSLVVLFFTLSSVQLSSHYTRALSFILPPFTYFSFPLSNFTLPLLFTSSFLLTHTHQPTTTTKTEMTKATDAPVNNGPWPYAAGYDNCPEVLDPISLSVKGTIPPWLEGALYRSGPG